ncbi:hypothetical protein ABZP36_010427 [Zizania latifolia]
MARDPFQTKMCPEAKFGEGGLHTFGPRDKLELQATEREAVLRESHRMVFTLVKKTRKLPPGAEAIASRRIEGLACYRELEEAADVGLGREVLACLRSEGFGVG